MTFLGWWGHMGWDPSGFCQACRLMGHTRCHLGLGELAGSEWPTMGGRNVIALCMCVCVCGCVGMWVVAKKETAIFCPPWKAGLTDDDHFLCW